MNIAIGLLTIVCLGAGSSITKHDVKVADKAFLAKQKFLFEIVYRVEDPLQFEEYIELGQTFTYNKADYTQVNMAMEKFYEAQKHGDILAKGDFFGALVKTHLKQAYGLFNFFLHANSWEVFQRNVVWARMHCNAGMFVYALTSAVKKRDDLNGLVLPSVYEIFPNLFFDSKFVHKAEKFDYDKWWQYKEDYNNNSVNTKDSHLWQWWKKLGLDEQWYLENNTSLNGTHTFYMPVDYTRNIDFHNRETALSYFTEDVGLNAYYYNYKLEYDFFLDGTRSCTKRDRRGEQWLYNNKQLMARYYMERLSIGLGEIEEFSYLNTIKNGYNSQLIYHNGVGFSYRENYYEFKSYGKFDYYYKVVDFFNRMDEIISKGVYVDYDGKTVDLRKPESIEYIGNIILGNVDDNHLFKDWKMLAHMYFGKVNTNDIKVAPNVLLNDETMMRDPLFYMFYKTICSFHYQLYCHFKPYTREELLFPGVTIKNVTVSALETYFDLVDFDVSNLLNDKLTFVDDQLVWDKILLARQTRLNHKPFDFYLNIESDKSQKVIVRTFLGPKYDVFGRVISLTKNRENFMQIDISVNDLNVGPNEIKRCSKDFSWTANDRSTYSKLYKNIRLAVESEYVIPLNRTEPSCGFPDRLILPRGWYKGMPMQFFFYVTPFTASYEPFSTFDNIYSCGIGSGVPYIDEMPFGFPFDREIGEYEFFVPNTYFKDVKIFHNDRYEKYYKQN